MYAYYHYSLLWILLHLVTIVNATVCIGSIMVSYVRINIHVLYTSSKCCAENGEPGTYGTVPAIELIRGSPTEKSSDTVIRASPYGLVGTVSTTYANHLMWHSALTMYGLRSKRSYLRISPTKSRRT